MAELPEIVKYSQQMDKHLKGKVIDSITINQEKCVNVSPSLFNKRAHGAKVQRVDYKGKWIVIYLDNGESILLNYGMGADVHAFKKGDPDPEKFQIKVTFLDGTGFTAKFWWFGTFHLAKTAELDQHPSFKDVALDPYRKEFTAQYFQNLLKGKRTAVKSFLLDQRKIGGIGNMYAHDIMFLAGVHPKTKISELSEKQIDTLYQAIQTVFKESTAKGTFEWEKDFFGQPGGWGGEGSDDFRVGYKEGEPCPNCGRPIEVIKAGSSQTYLCSHCQPLAG